MSENKENVKPKYIPKFKNTDDYIEYIFSTLKWKIHPEKYRLCNEYGKYLKEPELHIMKLFDETYRPDRANISFDRIMPLIQLKIHLMREKKWEEICHEIHGKDFDGSQQELKKLIEIIVPQSEESMRDVGLTRHKLNYLLLNFIKQIKHKLILEEDLDYPVVPIFYGAQGIAKSKLVKFITEPFGYFVKKMNVEQITDLNRFYRLLRDKIVIRIEELDGADKTNLAMLKSIVTDNEITAQKYYSQVPVEEFCFSTFVITSNKPSWEVFRDRSGNRRWGDFLILTEVDLKKLYENVDMFKIIQGVLLNNTDHEREKMRCLSEQFLIPDQNEMRVQDDVDEFVEEMNITVDRNDFNNSFISKNDIFEDFKDFRRRDLRPFPKDLTKKKFWLKMKDHLKVSECFGRNRKCKSDRGIKINLKDYKRDQMIREQSAFR